MSMKTLQENLLDASRCASTEEPAEPDPNPNSPVPDPEPWKPPENQG